MNKNKLHIFFYLFSLIPSFLIISLIWSFFYEGRFYHNSDPVPVIDYLSSFVPHDIYGGTFGNYYIASENIVYGFWYISVAAIFLLAGIFSFYLVKYYKKYPELQKQIIYITTSSLLFSILFVCVILSLGSNTTRNADVNNNSISQIPKNLPFVVSTKPRDKVIQYTVGEGEDVKAVAKKFNVSVDTILWDNTNLGSNIKPGQTLDIPPMTGLVYSVEQGETVQSIAQKFHTDPQKIIDFPFNTFKDLSSFSLTAHQTLFIPDGKP